MIVGKWFGKGHIIGDWEGCLRSEYSNIVTYLTVVRVERGPCAHVLVLRRIDLRTDAVIL